MKYRGIYKVHSRKDGRLNYITEGGTYRIGEVRTHTYGCLLLGTYRGRLKGQRAVLGSRIILRKFMSLLQGHSFKLQIIEAFKED